MAKKKTDPRSSIALDLVSNLFMNSTTKFKSQLTKLDPNDPNDSKLIDRALASVNKSLSPKKKGHSIERISQLGPGALWQGIDRVVQKRSKTSGN